MITEGRERIKNGDGKEKPRARGPTRGLTSAAFWAWGSGARRDLNGRRTPVFHWTRPKGPAHPRVRRAPRARPCRGGDKARRDLNSNGGQIAPLNKEGGQKPPALAQLNSVHATNGKSSSIANHALISCVTGPYSAACATQAMAPAFEGGHGTSPFWR